jgi:hypothetical protein
VTIGWIDASARHAHQSDPSPTRIVQSADYLVVLGWGEVPLEVWWFVDGPREMSFNAYVSSRRCRCQSRIGIRPVLLTIVLWPLHGECSISPAPQIAKDGTAIVLQDYASLPRV